MVDARKMVIIVLDVAWNEGSLRRRMITPKQSDWRVVPRIGRVTDKRTAACMHTTFCEVMLSNRVYLKVESLYHILMVCPHVSMSTARKSLKTDVENLCHLEAGPLALCFQNHPSLASLRSGL